MNALENGMLVQHRTLGVGKVVALEKDAVHVFFADAGKRFAAKLRLPFALGMLSTDDVAPHAALDGLPRFELDEETGRFGLPPERRPARKPRAPAAAKKRASPEPEVKP